MPNPWSETDDATLQALHDEGLSLNATAKRMDRPTSTVARAARRLGISWDRTRTEAAIRARVTDARARRAALHAAQLDLLADAQTYARTVLGGGGYRVVRRREGGAEIAHDVEAGAPILQDVTEAGRALKELGIAEKNLAPTDDASTAEAGKSLVGNLMDALRSAPRA